MAPTKLKIKGNKAFSLLSIETDEDLSKTWRLMTKVKDALDYGMRLENLSWRLWFMHHLMVHDQKSHSQFKKLSTATTKKLEIEKGAEIKSLSAPLYRPKPQGIVLKRKGRKKNVKKQISTDGSQVKKTDVKDVKVVKEVKEVKEVKPAKPTTESTSGTEMDTSSSPINHPNDNNIESDNNSQTDDYSKENEIIATVTSNDQTSAELMLDPLDDDLNMNMVDNGTSALVNENARSLVDILRYQNFYLRQYTNDQDPYQVVSLPGVFDTSFDAQAILDPNNEQPTMMLDLNEVLSVHQFYSSPDSSEPTSPTEIEWYAESVANSSSLQYQTLNNQLVGRTSSAGLHDAVYVRASDPSPVPSHLNINTITSMNTPHNTPLNTPVTAIPNSHMNNVYMNPYVPEQNNTSNTSASLEQHQDNKMLVKLQIEQSQQGSPKSAVSTTSPSSSASSVDASSVPVARPSTNTSPSTENNKPKKAHPNVEQQCFNCGVTSTPLWRRSANDELLCNACGLYLKLHKMARPKTMKPHIVRKDARDDEASQPVCSNCGTMTTPLWRRDEEGQTLCNACGLYFKLHHERRPLSMKTDVIKKRQRYENGQAPSRRGGKKQRNETGQQETQQQQQQPQQQPQSQRQQQPQQRQQQPQRQSQPQPQPQPQQQQQQQQGQQSQVIYNGSNGPITVPSTSVPQMGPISVGQSTSTGLNVHQPTATTASINGGYQ